MLKENATPVNCGASYAEIKTPDFCSTPQPIRHLLRFDHKDGYVLGVQQFSSELQVKNFLLQTGYQYIRHVSEGGDGPEPGDCFSFTIEVYRKGAITAEYWTESPPKAARYVPDRIEGRWFPVAG